MTATISRRQILSRSRDAGLDAMQQKFAPYEDYEEMWFSHEHLFKDHISEVLRKWEQIDDEIWAKMIFMSRNRRIAKAYVRVPAVIINGSEDGFDGFKVGLNGFDDPFRDQHTDKLMNYIDECRIGIDDSGNIIIKRYSAKSGVYIKSYPCDFSESCVSKQVITRAGSLDQGKPYVIFEMAKFEAAMMKEMKSAYPDRRRLEHQCIVVVAFVRDHPTSILDLPIYVMLINCVALDLLKSKLNPVIYQSISNSSRAVMPDHHHHPHSQYSPNSRQYSNRQNGTILANSHQQSPSRVNGRNESRIRVPDFVSIFQHNQSNSHSPPRSHSDEDDFEDEDTIYGRIGDSMGPRRIMAGGGVSDDYISDYEYRRFVGGPQNTQRYGGGGTNYGPRSVPNYHTNSYPFPQSSMLPSMSTIRSTPRQHQPALPPIPTPNYRDNYGRFEDDLVDQESVPESEPPPKLPPRDKKKLSKQINTIKKSRKQDKTESPYSIEIPSPDYHLEEQENGHHHPQNPSNSSSSSTKDQRRKSWSPFKSSSEQKAAATAAANSNYQQASTIARQPVTRYESDDRDHIYDTMSRSKSMMMPSKVAKSSPNSAKMTASTIHLPPKNANANVNRNGQTYRDRMIEDEDPYYSGLEARITSKKMLNGNSGSTSPSSKNKGLHWMMRKVLSSNYINMLTSKRHKSNSNKNKSAKSGLHHKSSADSSTDSDPYMSINEVYEPIYGYTSGAAGGGKNYSNPFWPTMQRTSKKH